MSANCGRHCVVWWPVNLSVDQISMHEQKIIIIAFSCHCFVLVAHVIRGSRRAHCCLASLSLPLSASLQLTCHFYYLCSPIILSISPPCVPNSPLCTRALLLRILLSLTGVLIFFFSSSTSFHLGFPLPSAALSPPSPSVRWCLRCLAASLSSAPCLD